jgi:hypothetical protein
MLQPISINDRHLNFINFCYQINTCLFIKLFFVMCIKLVVSHEQKLNEDYAKFSWIFILHFDHSQLRLIFLFIFTI